MLPIFKITWYPTVLSQQNYVKYIEGLAGMHPHFVGRPTVQHRYCYLQSVVEQGAFISSISNLA